MSTFLSSLQKYVSVKIVGGYIVSYQLAYVRSGAFRGLIMSQDGLGVNFF